MLRISPIPAVIGKSHHEPRKLCRLTLSFSVQMSFMFVTLTLSRDVIPKAGAIGKEAQGLGSKSWGVSPHPALAR